MSWIKRQVGNCGLSGGPDTLLFGPDSSTTPAAGSSEIR